MLRLCPATELDAVLVAADAAAEDGRRAVEWAEWVIREARPSRWSTAQGLTKECGLDVAWELHMVRW